MYDKKDDICVNISTSGTSRAFLGPFLILAMLLGLSPIHSALSAKSSSDTPIAITNVHELQGMQENLSAHYILANDIDASETVDWNDGKGFQPIGVSDYPFMGTFDGQGFVIKNLHVDRPDEDYVGLFGNTYGEVEIRNVGVVDVNVSGNRYVGSLVAYNSGNLSNSYATGGVIADGEVVGGLVGYNRVNVNDSYAIVEVTGTARTVGGLAGYNGGHLNNSYAIGNVTGRTWVGGFVGSSSDDGVSDSYATGDVTGDNGVGGLIGQNFASVFNSYGTGSVIGDDEVGGLAGVNHWLSEISGSYATGDVFGDSRVGGLVGRNSGSVNDAYATGDVNGAESVGGLIGYNGDGTSIVRTYSIGKVAGQVYLGGLVGWNMGQAEDSFWDVETSGTDESGAGIGKTTEQMKDIETFTNVGWDFEDVWGINNVHPGQNNDGYPFLRWQDLAHEWEAEFDLDYELPVLVGESVTVTVVDNHEDPATYLDIVILAPDGTKSERSTGSDGKFSFTPDQECVHEIFYDEVAEDNLVGSIAVVSEPLEVETEELPDGLVDEEYEETLEATGGKVEPGYTWSVVAGELPDGLELGDETGVISGTPTEASTFEFTVEVTDGIHTADQELAITVGDQEKFDPWIYDVNDDEVIDKSEALQAVADYFDGGLTKLQVLEVVALYFNINE